MGDSYNNYLQEHTGDYLGVADVIKIVKNALPENSPSSHLTFGQSMTSIRAYIYGIVAGKNDKLLRLDEFLVGCNRYGLDCPVPIITRRMSNYGTADEIDKEFKRILAKYKKLGPDIKKL